MQIRKKNHRNTGAKHLPLLERLEDRGYFSSINLAALAGTSSPLSSPNIQLNYQPADTLPAPVAVSPGSTTAPGPVLTTLTPTFTWQAISATTFTGYQINLYDSTTTAFVSYTTGKGDTSFTVPSTAPLTAGNAYTWNVRALNGTASGSPSAYLNFQTPPATTTLPAPVAASPGTSTSPGPVVTTLTPTLEWHAISGVTFTGYQITLYDSTTSTSASYTTGTSVTSFAIPTSAPLVAGNAYVWNVRAINGTVSGPPSNYLYFQTPSSTVTLPAPVAASPGTSTSPGPVVTTLTPTLEWHAISGVTFTGYQITLYDSTTSTSASYTTGTSVTSFAIPTSAPLVAGNTYVWNVRAVNGTVSGPPSNYLYFQAPSATVTLPAPVAVSPGTSTSPGPVLTTLTPTLEWKAISGVTFTGYQITLYDSTNSTSASYTTGTSVTSFAIPTSAPLIAGNSYTWNVRALNGTQSGPPSNYLFFQTPPATVTLPAPVAVSPGTSTSPGTTITTLTPTFTWQAISGVTFTGYQINLYDATTKTSVSYTTGADATSFTVPDGSPLVAGNAYVWNVRALNGTQSGPPSNYLYFQTPSATTTLPAPVAVSPGSSTSPGIVITTLTPTFEWQAISGVTFTGYQINLYDSTTGKLVSYTTDAGTTSFTVPTTAPLVAGNSYTWNVRALNGTVSGPPSNYLYFQTPSATTTLPAPVAISPGTGTSPGPVLTTLNPTFTWQAISGVTFTGYQITLFDSTANTSASYSTGSGDTGFTIPTTAPLIAGHAYTWNVRALNGTVTGPPSNYLFFQAPAATTTLPAPVAVSPGSATSPGPVLTTVTPTLTWQAISGATFTGYQINLYDSTAKTGATYTTGTSATSFTIPTTAPLIAGHAYTWNVRALNGTQSGPPSNYLFFQAPPSTTVTLPAPIAISPGVANAPGPVLTTLTPTFTWQGITGATFTGYQINLYDDTTKTSASFTVGTGDTSFTISATAPLIAGNAYTWNVRAVNGTQSGPPSNYLNFQTLGPVTLPTPVAISPGMAPAPGSLLTTVDPTFSWTAVTGVPFTGYQLYIHDITADSTVGYTVDASVTSLTPTAPLTAGDSFVWNVRTLNGTQSGPPSNYLFFQTPAPTPPIVSAIGGLVQPGLVTSAVPSVVSIGAVVHGSTTVKVANSTAAKFKGMVTTELFASTDGVIDDSSVLIATTHKTLSIKAGKSVKVSLKFKSLPAGLDGTYSLLARTTDASGISADSSSGPTIQVASPFVALSAAFAPLSASALKSGATIILSNFGNANDVTKLSYSVGFSTDPEGQNPAGSVNSAVLHRVTIKAGKSIKIHLHNWKAIAAALDSGSYYLTVVLTDQSGISTTAVSSTNVVKI